MGFVHTFISPLVTVLGSSVCLSVCLFLSYCSYLLDLTIFLLSHFFLSSIEVDHLETELQERIRQRGGPVIDKVYFNKGL